MDGQNMRNSMQYQFGGSMEEEKRWLAMEKVIPRLALKDVWTSDERCLKQRDAKPLTRIGSRWLVPSLGNSCLAAKDYPSLHPHLTLPKF